MCPIYEEDYSRLKGTQPPKGKLFSTSDIDINTIYYEISGICNAKCRYCPTGSGATRDKPSRFIPPEEFSLGLNRLYEFGLLRKNTFFGLYNWGDPLLHPKLDEILSILYENDQPYVLSTNASFIPKNLDSSSLENLSLLRISIPGFSQKSYDKIHKLNFDTVLENIDILSDMVPPNVIEVGFFLYKFNSDELSEACEYFNKKNIGYRLLMPYLFEYDSAVEYLTDNIDPKRKQTIENDLFTDYIKPMLLCRDDRVSCTPLQKQLVIDEFNNVLTCCVLSKNNEEYCVGSLLELTKEDIINVKTKGKKICQKCLSLGIPYWYDHYLQYIPREFQAINVWTICYIDTGDGFSENQKVKHNIYPKRADGLFDIYFDLKKYSKINALRWDPIDESFIGISIDESFIGISIDEILVEFKNGEEYSIGLAELIINGCRISENEFLFNTSDPWIIIPVDGSMRGLKISGRWIKKETLVLDIISLKHSLAEYKSQVVVVQQQANELASIKQSIVWQGLMKFQKIIDLLLPQKTGRRYLYDRAFAGGRILINEGFSAFRTSFTRFIYDNNPSYQYKKWINQNEPSQKELMYLRESEQNFSFRPKISIILPVWNVEKKWLQIALKSVIKQIYTNWELCIVDGGSTKPYIKRILTEYAKKDPRIKLKFLSENKGIAENSNEALSLATGQFVGFLDHDDELAPFALYEVVKKINQDSNYQFIYSDEDKIDEKGKRKYPFFKPDWSPDTFLSQNYICHFSVMRKTLIDTVGGFRNGYDGSQDFDLFLRCTEKISPNDITHIPKILYHWRINQGSAANNPSAKPYAFTSAKKALEDALNRRNIKGKVEDGLFPSTYRIRYIIDNNPKISIIIPSKDSVDILSRCIESILEKTEYDNYEIVVIDNQSTEDETFAYYHLLKSHKKIKILYYDKPFNYSAINNFAVAHLDSPYILLLNNDTEVISDEWLSAMLEHAQRDCIGAVGAKLLYPNNQIQHAGVILGITGSPGKKGVAGHSNKYLPNNDNGYFSSPHIIKNYSAVTAACLMMRREVFQEVGGFDENIAVAFNDVDLCLKIREKGYLIIYTPYAKLFHHESLTRGYEDTWGKKIRFRKETVFIREKWGGLIDQGDPYYSPNLTLDREDFSIKTDY